MYLIDTNILSYGIKGNKEVVNKFAKTDPVLIYTCSIVQAEIYYGLENHPNKLKVGQIRQKYDGFFGEVKIVHFDSRSATIYGQIKYFLKQLGRIVEDMDIMIASVAITHNLILVTNNTRHFADIPGLVMEDWSVPQ